MQFLGLGLMESYYLLVLILPIVIVMALVGVLCDHVITSPLVDSNQKKNDTGRVQLVHQLWGDGGAIKVSLTSDLHTVLYTHTHTQFYRRFHRVLIFRIPQKCGSSVKVELHSLVFLVFTAKRNYSFMT